MPRMTKAQIKDYIHDPDNWEVIPGNQYVQCARFKHPTIDLIKIQHKYDANEYRYFAGSDEVVPHPVWKGNSFWYYDPEKETLTYSISQTEFERKLYEEFKNDQN